MSVETARNRSGETISEAISSNWKRIVAGKGVLSDLSTQPIKVFQFGITVNAWLVRREGNKNPLNLSYFRRNENPRVARTTFYPDIRLRNQKIPMDEILSNLDILDKGDSGISLQQWDEVNFAAIKVFKEGKRVLKAKGLILEEATYEFGLNKNGKVMIVGDLHNSDSSKIWFGNSYFKRLAEGKSPEKPDPETLYRIITKRTFNSSRNGGNKVPKVKKPYC